VIVVGWGLVVVESVLNVVVALNVNVGRGLMNFGNGVDSDWLRLTSSSSERRTLTLLVIRSGAGVGRGT